MFPHYNTLLTFINFDQKFLSKLDAHILKTSQDEEPTIEKDPVVETAADFINDLKNAATIKSYEQAGFIYEPTSGLYW